MSAVVDTPEAVEAMLRNLRINRHHLQGRLDGDHISDAFRFSEQSEAMLRRLHARAMEAEAQASRAISAAENWHHETRRTREASATARAEARKVSAGRTYYGADTKVIAAYRNAFGPMPRRDAFVELASVRAPEPRSISHWGMH